MIKLPAASEQYFVLTLPLRPQPWQQQILEKRFEINRQIYNALLQKALKRYRQMIQTRAWRANRDALSGEKDREQRRQLLKEREELVKRYRLSRYEICKDATPFRQHFSEHTDSPVTQNLADCVWHAVDALIQGRAVRLHEKEEGELRSLSGKTNNSSIKFRDGTVVWKGLILPAGLKQNAYEQKALSQKLCFCRIKRGRIRGKTRYFVELVLRGRPPGKDSKPSSADSQTVGLKAGFHEAAAVSGKEAVLVPFPQKDRELERRKRELVRYMERSRRCSNPDNYLPDGKIRDGSAKWNYSNRYRRARAEYQELCRKQRALQRERQFLLARQVAAMGDRFYIEDIRFKRFGYTKPGSLAVQKNSPAAFLKILEQKLMQQGKELVLIEPFVLKTTGFNHLTGAYQKVPVRKSWRIVAGQKVNKKLYSAFLLRHVRENGDGFDLEKCRKDFAVFLGLQEKCLKPCVGAAGTVLAPAQESARLA